MRRSSANVPGQSPREQTSSTDRLRRSSGLLGVYSNWLRCSMLVVSAAILLTACSTTPEATQPTPVLTSGTTAVAPNATPLPAVAPTPEAGKATVVGRVQDLETSAPMTRTLIFLAGVTRQDGEAIFVFDGASSPNAETDLDGHFIFSNIPAREYVLVVGDPLGSYVIFTDETNHPKVWNAAADQVLDMGELSVTIR
jgi:hypothetical protein